MSLSKFERHDVLSAGMEIPGAAGGLREPLKLDPVEMHLEAECYVVMRLRTTKIRFDPIKDSDGALTRVHVMEVVEAAFVDGDIVEEQLAETRRRIGERKKLEDEAKGTPQLPLDEAASSKPRQTREQAKAVTEVTTPPLAASPSRSPEPIGVA
jgi:hypothetical protein